MKESNYLLATLVAIYLITLGTVVIGNSSLSADWLGFWGNILGALLSAAVAYFIFWLGRYRDQLTRTEAEERAHIAATVALTHPIHCAATILTCCKAALSTDNPVYKENLLKGLDKMASQLEATCAHFTIEDVTKQLAIEIRIPVMMILIQLNTVALLLKHQAGLTSEDQAIKNHIETLRQLRRYLPMVDVELDESFARDSGETQ